MKPLWAAAIAAAFSLQAPLALADGTSNPAEARKTCEKQGKAGNPADLKACCDNQILVATAAEQKKLVAKCAQGKADDKPAKK
jgi:hypothetical protein